VLPENNSGVPLVPQIMSKHPADFVRLAKELYDVGYDTVNWNLGCPVPMVAKKKRGSGMLPYPDLIDGFLSEVIPKIPGKLSIKCRLGRMKADEIFRFMPVFNRYPLEEVIIHPRTGIQMYEGKTDPDTFEKCLELSVNPLVYNGDIRSPADFFTLSNRFQALESWMIGRGALINPFLPGMIKKEDYSIPDKMNRIAGFHETLFERYRAALYGPAHLMDRMKGIWKYLSNAFENPGVIFKKIKKVRSIKQYNRVVSDFFDHEPELKGIESVVPGPLQKNAFQKGG
ncbi:MAG: tRNA-dihydrouridine synthase family protein, partial [Deltaproteobacteria bacterium]|nr:tRNA-dihydrouridine synthase family protein [Deltaproteobacteria bacterium]